MRPIYRGILCESLLAALYQRLRDKMRILLTGDQQFK